MAKLYFKDKIVVEREERRNIAAGVTEYYYYPKLITMYGDLVYIRKKHYPDSVLCAKNRKQARELGEKVLERMKRNGEILTDDKKEQTKLKRRSIYLPN